MGLSREKLQSVRDYLERVVNNDNKPFSMRVGGSDYSVAITLSGDAGDSVMLFYEIDRKKKGLVVSIRTSSRYEELQVLSENELGLLTEELIDEQIRDANYYRLRGCVADDLYLLEREERNEYRRIMNISERVKKRRVKKKNVNRAINYKEKQLS